MWARKLAKIWINAPLPNPADAPSIAVNLRELALLRETLAVLRATFRSTLAAGADRENWFVIFGSKIVNGLLCSSHLFKRQSQNRS